MFCGNNTKNRLDPINDIDQWELNDIVTVKVDCNEWKVTFYINDKQVGKT